MSWLFMSKKKSTFVLVSGFFGCCIFTIMFKYYLTGEFLKLFLNNMAPCIATPITIFNAELYLFLEKIVFFRKFMCGQR